MKQGRYKDEEGFIKPYKINIYSSTLAKFITQLDFKILDMEEEIEFLKSENNELNKKISQNVNDSIKHSQMMIGETLKACLGQPSISSVGTVGATMLAKIGNMKDIKEVHAYLNDFKSQNKKELAEMKKNQKINEDAEN